MLNYVDSSSISVDSYPVINSPSPLPSYLEKKAFRHCGDYAWHRGDVAEVLDYCLASSLAITGGEGWVVRWWDKQESLTAPHRWAGNYVVYQVVPQRNGRIAAFSWQNCWVKEKESWPAYVVTTVQQARNMIESGQFEATVLADYAPHVYYKLSFEGQDELAFRTRSDD